MTKKQTGNYLGAHVGWKISKAFDAEARRRGIHRSRLIARVLVAVAQDNIWDGVIGIMETTEEKTKS